jgi:hypothetical protein
MSRLGRRKASLPKRIVSIFGHAARRTHEAMPNDARPPAGPCAACSEGHSAAAWRDLPRICTLGQAELVPFVIGWPEGRVVEVRACSACGRAIARSVTIGTVGAIGAVATVATVARPGTLPVRASSAPASAPRACRGCDPR